MEEKICINEYVRTKTGKIDKVINNNYYMPQYIECEKRIVEKKNIVNHSFNIEELLGKGDYVNGHQIVDEVYGEDDNDLYFEIEGGYNQAKCIKENEIETILTKEQYERDCYKIN